MGEQKIRGARKVDQQGKEISNLKEWKLSHPDEVYYDSLFEWKATMLFKEKGIDFIYQPGPFTLVPAFSTNTFDFGPEDKKEYNRLKRGKKKAAKAKVTRDFNKSHYKKITPYKYSKPMTWSTDFYLPDYNIYVEIKGHPNDVFPFKLKLAQYLLPEETLIVIYTMKDLNDFVNYLTNTKNINESIKRNSTKTATV